MRIFKKKYFFLLGFIILLAGLFRFTAIDRYPVSLYWDEAALGYNAFSIAYTGKDEYGIAFPALFQSFNDYKASGYIYFTAIFVRLFGLNEFSIRFGSALLGTVTVLITYFLCVGILTYLPKKTAKNSLTDKLYEHKNIVGLIAAGLLAFSPWHIHFSRIGFEANAALFFIVLGAWLLLRGVRSIGLSFVIGMVSFAISLYFYRSTYVFTPLFLFGFFLIFRKEFWQQIRNKYFWLGIIVFLILFLPFFPKMISEEGLVRAKQTSVFNSFEEDLNRAAIQRQKLGDPLWARIIYDRRIIFGQKLLENYMTHFHPSFLFIEGDRNGRHRTIGFGQMYVWESVFLLIGIYVLFRIGTKVRNVILLWILIAPFAAAVSQPAPHALRSLNMLPMPQIVVALGIWYCGLRIIGKWKILYIGVLTILLVSSFVRYVSQYIYTTKVVSNDWADGYKQLTQYVFQKENNYDKIIISGHYWQPHIYFLVYKQYDPALYQQQGAKEGFDKYLFGGTGWDQGTELDEIDLANFAQTENILVALAQLEYNIQKNNIRVLKKIYNHNNELVFIVGELKHDKKIP